MSSRKTKIAILAATTAFWPTFASSQQGGAGASGGMQMDIGVNTSVRSDSNFALDPVSTGTSYVSDTKLSFGLTSVTSGLDFSLLGTSTLRYADIPGRTIRGLEDPTLRLRLVADSANSRLTLTGRYRNVDREFLDPFQVEKEQQQTGTLLANGGTLEEENAALKYELGLTAPVGAVLDLAHDARNYTNVTTAQLFDNRTDSAKATALFRVSPVTTVSLSAGMTRYSANDIPQTDRETTDYALGLTQEINPTLTLDTSLGFTEVKTTDLTGITSNSGLVGAMSLVKTLQNGTVFGDLATTRNQNGRRVTLTFGRDIQMPTATLSAKLGYTDGDSGRGAVVGSLAYSQQLSTDKVDISISRNASTNGLDQDIVDSRISAAYTHVINNLSQLGLSFDWGQTKDTGATGAPTIESSNLTATYSRDLTADWTMTGGLTLRRYSETGFGKANSTALFLSLGRNFSYRP
ncbi:MAG: hypothetical protein ORN49_14740 [Rhodobacteraceae bacterium]|nr:hypothetical protein [Paracoccaceae bacterium]